MYRSIYFIGIGGIGMSALARYFLHRGMRVAGYDLTRTPLTRELEKEGAEIHYTDDTSQIPPEFRDPARTLVVFTPAVPSDHSELVWFRDNDFMIEKRSEMLGHLSEGKFTMAIAGTHGKTTTTTLTAWLNRQVTGGGSAFLGGISKNFGSNLVLGAGDRLAVEADEYDRSFLRLHPDVAVITSTSADHLDVYGTHHEVREAFSQFADKIKPGGILILNTKANIGIRNPRIAVYTYSLDDGEADFYATDLHPLPGGHYGYGIQTPDGIIENLTLGVTGRINVENSIAAVALMWAAARIRGESFDHDKVCTALATFQGVRRRFDFWVNTQAAVYMDDYAHHPEELSAALSSLRAMFPGRRITAVFQPHLYTRTHDFASGFADALSLADEMLLTPIYPARELPIEGVNSETIGRLVKDIPWRVVEKERLADTLDGMATDVVVTFGAGNIENHCAEIAEVIKAKADLHRNE